MKNEQQRKRKGEKNKERESDRSGLLLVIL